MLAEYKQDEYAVFKRNPNYWGTAPKVDQITVKIIPDGETRVLAFEKGDLDLIYGEGMISLDAFQELRDNDKYVTQLSDPVGTRSLLLNSSIQSCPMSEYGWRFSKGLTNRRWWKA